jgi:SCP-2 sterol transfer family
VPAVATKEECAAALDRLAAKLGGMGEADRSKHLLERTVSCEIPDLRVTFHGTLKDARLIDVTSYDDGAQAPRAQVRLTIPSDDLPKLVDGQLNFISAWVSGRIKVNGSFGDLLRLRKVF